MPFQSRSVDLYAQGVNLLEQGKYLEAIELFSQVIEIDGHAGSAAAYTNRALAYESLAKGTSLGSDSWRKYFDHVIDDFTEAINIFSVHVRKSDNAKAPMAQIYYLRANAYFCSYRYTEAIDDLSEAIRLNGNLPQYYSQRGLIYCERLNDPTAALQDFSKALHISETAWGYIHRAWAKLELGDINGAKGDYDKAIVLDPNAKDFERILLPRNPITELDFDKMIKWDNFKKNLKLP